MLGKGQSSGLILIQNKVAETIYYQISFLPLLLHLVCINYYKNNPIGQKTELFLQNMCAFTIYYKKKISSTIYHLMGRYLKNNNINFFTKHQ